MARPAPLDSHPPPSLGLRMSAPPDSTDIAHANRLIIKIGSALLVDEARSTVHRTWLEALIADIARLHAAGREVLIVSSGAIALGRRPLGWTDGPLRLEQKQAAAATGMIRLAHAFQETLARHHITVAQVLLTLSDTEHRRRYLNARKTLTALLNVGAIPLINENDTVATDEIKVGDNDRLAARVAAMVSADTLVLLSDVDGLYTANPRKDPTARWLPVVRTITADIEAAAGGSGSGVGTGGMVTKIAAARITLAAGCRLVIADGRVSSPLAAIEAGARCTWFLPSTTPQTHRKRWIGGALRPSGTLVVDSGAERALAAGKSLLPAGVIGVNGDFEKGDAVIVVNTSGREIGRGLVAYSADDARRIVGRQSVDFEMCLGWRGPDELIHRDDLVVR